MEALLEKFIKSGTDYFSIGLGRVNSKEWTPYFCTPVGAHVFADLGCDGVHFCTIDGFGDRIFVVSPELDGYVFSAAENFGRFLSLVPALGSANKLDQIPVFPKEALMNDVPDDDMKRELEMLEKEFGVKPADGAYDYVKSCYENFMNDEAQRSRIEFSDEYYDVTGTERE